MADWSFISEKTFTPDDLEEVVGSYSLEPEADTVWVRITQLSQSTNSPWSYGILSWRTSEGRELGSIKAYGNVESEVFTLRTGRTPSQRDGVLTFTPRGFNLGWIKNGFPWPLRFEATSGSVSEGTPAFGTKATLMVPAVPEGNAEPDYLIEDAFAYLLFNFLFK